MNHIGNIIKEYRTTNHLSMQEFADKTGLSKGYVSMLERGRHPQNGKEIIPSIATISKIAKTMGISVDALLELTEANQQIRLGDPATPPNRIKVYGSVPAGVPIEAIEDIVDWEDIPLDWLSGGREYLGLRVKGKSMEPKYLEGDTIIVLRQDDCESGQDAVVYVNGYDATLKKVIKQQFGIVLQPLNPDFEPMFYDYGDESDPIRILGVVVEIRRKV